MSKRDTLIAMVLLFGLVQGCDQAGNHLGTSLGKDRYIVVLKKESRTEGFSASAVHSQFKSLSVKFDLSSADHVFTSSLSAAVFELSEDEVRNIERDPAVAYVEKDQIISVQAVQNQATWGLDRLDQVSRPLDGQYNYLVGGDRVNAYVIDTGIALDHSEFEGRVRGGVDLVDNDNRPDDCNGHGSHVAGSLGSATYGVAKNVDLYGVRVLNCYGQGSLSTVIAGIEWVKENHQKPAVVNLSLGGGNSQALDQALVGLIQSGVTAVVAAGNSRRSACEGSPNRVAQAITVGAVDSSDSPASFSNYGECVDIFAPGKDIESVDYKSETLPKKFSGTSMAAPHVAGVVALYLSHHPEALPEEVESALMAGAVQGQLQNLRQGSPNILLNNQFVQAVPEEGELPTGPVEGAPCFECLSEEGQLSGGSDYAYHPGGRYYHRNSQVVQKIWLKGKDGFEADLDLYLLYWTGSEWTTVARSIQLGANEVIQYSGRAGYYTVKVDSYSGAGSYTVWIQ